MARLFAIVSFCFIAHLCGAQVQKLSLINEDLMLPKLNYKVVAVIDGRLDTNYLGRVKYGPFNKPRLAKLKGGNAKSIKDFVAFNMSLAGDDSFPVYMKIAHLELVETITEYAEVGACNLIVYYYLNIDLSGEPFYATSTTIVDTVQDVYPTHIKRLKRALKTVLIDFNAKGFSDEDYVPTINESRFAEPEPYVEVNTASEKEIKARVAKNKQEKQDSSRAHYNATFGGRNVWSIGYQIGGWTLIGACYEVRFNDWLGAHFGAGLTGATVGVNFHINPSKNSLYFSPNFKDGGLGEIGSICFEIGGRIPFKKRSYTGFGLQIQGGIQSVAYISREFQNSQQNLTGSFLEQGDLALSIGIGFAF